MLLLCRQTHMLPPSVTPLLVLVNVKSGGQQGMELIRSFRKLLNPHQVYDLMNGGPLPGFVWAYIVLELRYTTMQERLSLVVRLQFLPQACQWSCFHKIDLLVTTDVMASQILFYRFVGSSSVVTIPAVTVTTCANFQSFCLWLMMLVSTGQIWRWLIFYWKLFFYQFVAGKQWNFNWFISVVFLISFSSLFSGCSSVTLRQ